MAKYRGKYNGQTRGKYVKAAVTYLPKNVDEWFDLKEQLHFYFFDKGYCIGVNDYSNDTLANFLYAYHVAGATIGMTAMNYETENKGKHGAPQHSIRLVLVSNDCLDDLVKMITDNFAGFKKVEPKKYL